MQKSLFKDIDINEEELNELWEILEPLQCLNCHKVLKCTQCDFNQVFDQTIKFIVKWGKKVSKT